MYKLLALIVGAVVLAVVALVTATAGPAVLTAAGVATAVWVFGATRR